MKHEHAGSDAGGDCAHTHEDWLIRSPMPCVWVLLCAFGALGDHAVGEQPYDQSVRVLGAAEVHFDQLDGLHTDEDPQEVKSVQVDETEPVEGEFEAMILDRADGFGILEDPEGLRRLMGTLASTFDRYPQVRALRVVEDALHRPLSLDAVEARVSSLVMPLRTGTGEPTAAEIAAIGALVKGTMDLDAILVDQGVRYPEEQRENLRGLVEHMGRTWRVESERDRHLVDAIVATHERDGVNTASHDVAHALEAMLRHMASPMGRANAEDVRTVLESGLRRVEPQLVAELVSGSVQGAFYLEDGSLLVVGSEEANTYDMGRIAHVIDPGGDDEYRWPADGQWYRGQSIIDWAGNDLYDSDGPFVGPATGVFGWSIVDDRGGDDHYRSLHACSIAAGLMGVGLLIDRDGNDVYVVAGDEAAWNIGVGFYGAGVLIDRAGADVYRGEKLTQGIGGPRGLGVIVDAAGNDLYHANGFSNASTYGTPAVYLGLAQGFGYGVRGQAAGGLGAIYDLGGHDEYNGGEFSQGGGYFFGLGILRDSGGNDLYHANRYGQAFAAHQAAGILIDDAGDDTYWSKTAAGQSGSWDECVTMLIDRGGNDAYRCDGLGQGGAAMQAIALFFDLGGADRYAAAGGDTLGQSGTDTYHYERDGVLSFSAFFDFGGSEDAYPARRLNNTAMSTGVEHAEPARSTRFGVFVDE